MGLCVIARAGHSVFLLRVWTQVPGASLQGNGAASIKSAERFSGSTIEFEKFAIALDGAAVEDRGTRWKGDPVFFCFEPLIRRPPLSEINEK